MDCLNYIAEVLFLHKKCVLPEMGVLRLNYQSAQLDFANHQISAPQWKISWEETIEHPADENLLAVIAYRRNINETAARIILDNEIVKIKHLLAEGHDVIINGIGVLKKHLLGKIAFESFQAIPEAVTAQAVLNKHEGPLVRVGDKEVSNANVNYLSPEPEKKTNRWYLWLIPLIIIIGATLAWLFINNVSTPSLSSQDQEMTEESLPADSSEDTSAVVPPVNDSANITSVQAAPGPNDTISYHIVFGTYKNKDKAIHQYHKLRGWGHHVILLTKDSVTFRLAMPYRSLPKDTSKNLQETIKNYGSDAYIEYDRNY